MEYEQFRRKVTFIIKTFERKGCFVRMMKSIEKHYPGCTCIIVDDSYTPYAQEAVKGMDLQTVAIEAGKDIGLSKGRNIALSHVTTEYTILLDDDYVMTSKCWLKALEEAERGRYDIIALGLRERGKLFSASQNITIAGDTILCKRTKRKVGVADLVNNYFIAKTETLRSIGWDDRLKIVGEHLDFVIRAKQAGLKSFTMDNFDTLHVPGNNPIYRRHRNRRYISLLLAKHGLEKLIRPNGKVLTKKEGVTY